MGTAYYDSFRKAVPSASTIIPNAPALEKQSSLDIESLLNPPSLFPDTSRRAAEVSAGRGVAGSAAAWGTGLRMTDEERIRRMALGEQLMSGAYARNLPLTITPWQQAQIDQANLDRAMRERLALMGGGGRSVGGRGTPTTGITPHTTALGPNLWDMGFGGGGGGVPLGGMTPAPVAPGVGALAGAGFGADLGMSPGGSVPSFGDAYDQLFSNQADWNTEATSIAEGLGGPPPDTSPAMTEEQSYWYYGE